MKLVIPQVGKIVYSIYNKKKVLGFRMRRGYLESENYEELDKFINMLLDYKDIVLIGKIEVIILHSGCEAIYRQRLYFSHTKMAVNLCDIFNIDLYFPTNIDIDIEDVISCRKELPYLYYFSKLSGLTIDEWLVRCFKELVSRYAESAQVGTNYTVTDLSLDGSPYLLLGQGLEAFHPGNGYSDNYIKSQLKGVKL